MLQEMGKTTLVIILIDRAYFLSDVETSDMFRISIVTNVIGKSIIQSTDLHILVNRNQWHLLCHQIACAEQYYGGNK